MAILRSKIRWTIPGAGTAYSVMHWQPPTLEVLDQADVDAIIARLQAFCTSVKALLPNVVSLQVVNELEEVRETDGGLIGVWPAATQAVQTGTASTTAGWAAAAGAVITWNTAGVRNSRRIRGRTFLVPLSNEVWDVDGTIKAVPLTTLNNAAAALRNDSDGRQFGVLARETVKDANDGEFWPAQSHRVPDMSAILRSRRS